jgi:hypothetical protein
VRPSLVHRAARSMLLLLTLAAGTGACRTWRSIDPLEITSVPPSSKDLVVHLIDGRTMTYEGPFQISRDRDEIVIRSKSGEERLPLAAIERAEVR